MGCTWSRRRPNVLTFLCHTVCGIISRGGSVAEDILRARLMFREGFGSTQKKEKLEHPISSCKDVGQGLLTNKVWPNSPGGPSSTFLSAQGWTAKSADEYMKGSKRAIYDKTRDCLIDFEFRGESNQPRCHWWPRKLSPQTARESSVPLPFPLPLSDPFQSGRLILNRLERMVISHLLSVLSILLSVVSSTRR